jgi:hypothetical protein
VWVIDRFICVLCGGKFWSLILEREQRLKAFICDSSAKFVQIWRDKIWRKISTKIDVSFHKQENQMKRMHYEVLLSTGILHFVTDIHNRDIMMLCDRYTQSGYYDALWQIYTIRILRCFVTDIHNQDRDRVVNSCLSFSAATCKDCQHTKNVSNNRIASFGILCSSIKMTGRKGRR